MRVPRRDKKRLKKDYGLYYSIAYLLHKEMRRVFSTKGKSLIDLLKPHVELDHYLQRKIMEDEWRKERLEKKKKWRKC